VHIITVSDPEKKAAVYNEMVVQMNKIGWAARQTCRFGRGFALDLYRRNACY
jgi:hypothetical protein